MKRLILALSFLLIPSRVLALETATSVAVTSASAGTQIAASINGGICITVPTGAAVPVYVARVNGTCSTALTSVAGMRIPVPTTTSIWSTACFIPKQENYKDQLCAILESGVTSVTVGINAW